MAMEISISSGSTNAINDHAADLRSPIRMMLHASSPTLICPAKSRSGTSRSKNSAGRCWVVRAVHAAEPATEKARNNALQKTAERSLQSSREGIDGGGGERSISAPSTLSTWTVDSWKDKAIQMVPTYPDEAKLESILETLEGYPPLVFAGEARHLEEKLAEAAMGNAFLLQGGDCAESFKEFNAINIRDTFRVLLQMGVVLMFGGQMPVIKVGRMAGQFAKPRSNDHEEKGGVKLPSYRGDIINGDDFDEKARLPNPDRMMKAYSQSAATLNLLRSFATGGYAAMERVTDWNLNFMFDSQQGNRYRELANRVDEALGFMEAMGLHTDHPLMTTTDFWTSHECLLLPFEQAMTRLDSTTGRWYDCSAHMLWIGERTRQLDGAHFEFLRGVANPIGLKASDKMDPMELVKACQILNPENKPGRMTIIVRMGAERLRVKLPFLIRAVRDAGLIVTWVCDPMHGNTIKVPSGLKTRPFDAILVIIFEPSFVLLWVKMSISCVRQMSKFIQKSCMDTHV
ncbi:hypothetical protein KP509_15G008400 [Ceratopteris richardii]|uniref:Phospho-2-dehydro-3-deoxyheptonate aldolase n=1 Tax=Ceratopteris richardii TaxID=49495 RepID=A0A8T2T5G4_CERRI|nr:hypothetical protein KP509_15G008400 [Ceratopteris richardii]